MTVLRDASTMYASMFSLVLFMILFESRYPKKKTMTLTLGLMGPLMIGNCILLVLLGPVTMSTLLLLTCSLPSLIFFRYLARYRDGRFLFTFCFADTIMLEIIHLTAVLDYFLGNTYIFTAAARFVLCPLVCFAFYRWLRPTYLGIQQKVTKGWYTFAAIALIFYVLMSISISVPTHITERLEQLPAFLLLLALLPCIYAHIFSTLCHQQQTFEREAQEGILSLQVTSLLSRVEEFRAANDLLRQERHDFRHTMRAVAALAENGEYEKLKSMAKNYAEHPGEPTPESYCRHTLLDAVLSSYLQEAQRKDIRVTVKAAFPEILPVNESELAIVFANALENAIFACEKLPADQRYIEVRSITSPAFMLQVANSFDGSIAFDDDGVPLSSRKGHGFGTRSIVSFCMKNNAFYEFKVRGQEFLLKIIFG